MRTGEHYALNFSEIDENHLGRAGRQVDPAETPPKTSATPEITFFGPSR